jgi:5'-methylthioadenosine phosphorylase
MSGAIPTAEYAIVGGSATANCRVPEDAKVPGVKVLESKLFFDTPFGPTTEFKLLELEASHTADGQTHHALEVRMHGWRKGYNWATSLGPRQVFWTLKQAGVKKIVGNAGVGGINRLLEAGDLVIADDYLDYTQGRPSSLAENWPNSISMVEPYCLAGRAILAEQALAKFRRVHRVGVMGCSNGPYIESLALVGVMRQAGVDIVAQSTVPEINFAREIGACYAGVYLIVNPAGIVADPVVRQQMYRQYREAAPDVASVILQTLLAWKLDTPCGCAERVRPIALPYHEDELPS